jgi:1,4-alpha-glucan branching enzyme
MPGLCLDIEKGGIGFGYRLSMGLPDMWIDLVKNYRDEDWNMGRIWFELTNKRKGEKRVAYAESHDQALVGDKTLMFRLCDREMYFGMEKGSQNLVIDRGMALHKIIRLLTAFLGGEGYLNFMGNEFGHPEWIDFPREGNGNSFQFCRRQWSLAENKSLRYSELLEFDKALVELAKTKNLTRAKPKLIYINEEDKVIAAKRGKLIILANLNPTTSFKEFFVEAPKGIYKVILSTDHEILGGFDRVCQKTQYVSKKQGGNSGFKIYLPCRTGVVISD